MNIYDNLLKYIDKNVFITLGEAKRLGISPMTLSRLAAKEKIYRVEHGAYAYDLDWLSDPLKKYIIVCNRYPEAVICGISALTYYDLTDAEERQIWIALPPPKTNNNPRYRVVRPTGLSYTLGIKKYVFGRHVVRIYDLEKTVVDAFKYNTEEVALKAIKSYLKRKDKNIQKLCDYGRRLKKPLDDIVTILLSDE